MNNENLEDKRKRIRKDEKRRGPRDSYKKYQIIRDYLLKNEGDEDHRRHNKIIKNTKKDGKELGQTGDFISIQTIENVLTRGLWMGRFRRDEKDRKGITNVKTIYNVVDVNDLSNIKKIYEENIDAIGELIDTRFQKRNKTNEKFLEEKEIEEKKISLIRDMILNLRASIEKDGEKHNLSEQVHLLDSLITKSNEKRKEIEKNMSEEQLQRFEIDDRDRLLHNMVESKEKLEKIWKEEKKLKEV